MKTRQWAFLLLQNRCTGCGTCVLACKAWNHEKRGDRRTAPADGLTPPFLADPDDRRGTMRENWRRVLTKEEGSGPTDLKLSHISVSCQHCERPACAEACPTGRIFKEKEFGAVLVSDSIPCGSCGLCRKACPWNAPQFAGPKTPMTKCDLCYERIRKGDKPACAAACPTRALLAGPEEELLKRYPEAKRYIPPPEEGAVLLPHFWIVPRYKEL